MLPPDGAQVFAAMPVAALVIDPAGLVHHANAEAEQLLQMSERQMAGRPLSVLVPMPEGGHAHDGHGFAAYDTELTVGRGHNLRADYIEAQLPDRPEWRVLTIHPTAATRRLGHSADRIAGARAAVGAAAMLAHEIRNPLSGIRGAAQLIGSGELPTLIVREVDRIAALIDRMQEFGDVRPLPVGPANIYPLLAHVRALAGAGFAANVAIDERFDPSLPPARVNADALTQILLNLLTNACEAVRGVAVPRITLTTAFRHGLAVGAGPGRPRQPLPIEICVLDNGPGAPADISDHLFDPFVSGRPEGQGLGLALVDKLMRDMGGIAQYAREGSPERTVLRLLLPRGDG